MHIKRSIKFLLHTRKKGDAHGGKNLAIRMRVSYAGTALDFPTGLNVDAEYWDANGQHALDGFVSKSNQKTTDINRTIDEYRAFANELFARYELLEKRVPTSGEVKDLFNDMVGRSKIELPDPSESFTPDMKRVLEIARDVGILDFVEKLPTGFGTNVGENGVQLSGGQRQRIAIARALYKNPAVLILDEATSALDSESELHIKRVVNKLKESNKTVILIAHRLGTVMNADRIYVLENGTLVEEGSHHELLQNNSHYTKFWKSQTENNLI